MFKFSRNFEYALIALKHISTRKGKKISTAREISLQYELSFGLMARILMLLKNANMLNSIQGTKGGYELNVELDDVSILDLMQIISETPLLADCLADDKDKARKCKIKPGKCNISRPIKRVQMKVDNLIKKITLKEAIGL